MMVSFINSRVMELTVTSLNLLNRFLTTDFSEWLSMVNLIAGVPQGSVLELLFFLIYINDLPLGLTTNVKLFAGDTSLFSVVNNASVSDSRLNNDLVKIRDWIGKYRLTKILPNKQKRLFFKKNKNNIPGTHASLSFNNSLTEQATTQKSFGLT